MWYKVYIRYELRTFLQRCRGNSSCRTLLQTKRVCFVQTLYQHQSALPYMGCCILSSSSCSSNKGPRILRPTIQKNQDVDMYSPWSCCCFCWWWSLELLQRWSPAGQLKLKLLNIFAVSTNIVLCDKNNNCWIWDPRYDELLRAAVFGIAFHIF